MVLFSIIRTRIRCAHRMIEMNAKENCDTSLKFFLFSSRTAILTGVFTERTGMQVISFSYIYELKTSLDLYETAFQKKHFVIPNALNFQPMGIPLDFHILPQYLNKYGFESHIVGK